MKTKLLVVAGAMLIAASCPAWSQGYVGVAVGQTRMKNACDGAPSSISCDTKDSAIRLFGGYEVAPNAALELGFGPLGTAKASTGETADLSALDLSAVLSAPVGNRLALYGRLGLYYGEMSASGNPTPPAIPLPPPSRGWGSGNNTGFTFGFGASYTFTSNGAFRIDWQRFNRLGPGGSPTIDVEVLSLAALYRF